MVQRWATSSGFADVAGTWNGGTLPDPGDDLYANNFTVSIRSNLTANSLKKIAGTTAVAGGQFVVTAAATVNITAGIAATDGVTNSTYLLGVDAGSATVSINAATIVGGAGTGRVAIQVASGYTGTVTVTGSLTGGTTATSSVALSNLGAATIVVVGNVTGGSNGHGISSAAANANVTVTGNVTGGTGGGATGITLSVSTARLTVTGDVKGGSSSNTYGVTIASGSATIRGNLYPGSLAGGLEAISCAGVLRFSGHIYSGGMIASTGPNGYWPISGAWSAISGEEVYVHVYDDGNWPSGNNGTARTLTRYGTDNPVAADVRYGTTYGPSAGLTGTLRVPPAASVAAGVLTDATTGTAALSLSDVLAGTGAQIAAATSG